MTRRRCFTYCLVSLIPILAIAPRAVADEQTPVCKLGAELREATGFGPMVLATLGIEAQAHDAIAIAADTYCDTHRETIEPLLVAVRTARRESMRAIEENEDVAAKETALANALTAVQNAATTVTASMRSHLTADQQTKLDHWAANSQLDMPLCLLELTNQQREALVAARRARDIVALHPKMRKNTAAVNAARATYKNTLTATLTQEQQATLTSLKSALHANLVAAMEREEARCGE